jgi:putative endonuclease
VAASYLCQQGYTILQQNWRRRECEIDLVARKDRGVYFVEVKYRATDQAGSGLEYIRPQKLQQMAYAARRWVAEYGWTGDYALSAVAVSGRDFVVSDFIECLEL